MRDDGRWSSERVDRDRCQAMAAHVRAFDRMMTSYRGKDPDWEGFPGSSACGEMADARRKGGQKLATTLRAPYGIMQLEFFAASAHMTGVAALLELEEPPTEPITVLSRVILELSARAWGLADDRLTMRERAARGLLERYTSAREVQKLRASPDMNDSSMSELETPEDVSKEICALVLSFDLTTPKIEDQVRPNSTDLLTIFPGKPVADSHQKFYRLLSAPAHGTLYSLTLLFDGTPPDENEKTALTYRPSQAWLDGPVSTAVLAMCWSLQRIAGLLGWDQSPLVAYLGAVDVLYADVGRHVRV